jgi:hypothetical protein
LHNISASVEAEFCFTPKDTEAYFGVAGHIMLAPANQLLVMGQNEMATNQTIWPISAAFFATWLTAIHTKHDFVDVSRRFPQI